MDIVTLDLDLPSIGGFDVLEQICLFSDAPLIALTSSNEEMEKAWASRIGGQQLHHQAFEPYRVLSQDGGAAPWRPYGSAQRGVPHADLAENLAHKSNQPLVQLFSQLRGQA
jgi:CheY-like chemotaxis protein